MPLEDVLKSVEDRREVKYIDPPGELAAAIQFTRVRLTEHVGKSAVVVVGMIAALGSLFYIPTSGWITFNRNLGKTQVELNSALSEE